MNLIENIKEFFKLKGLNWTGDILTQTGKNFRPSTEQDFESLRNLDYLIDFGEDGQIALSAEIDSITFKVYGESFDVGFTCFAGKNEKNLKLIRKLEDKDLSKEFVQFQLQKCGLIYAVLLRKKCEEKTQQVEDEKQKRVNQLTRKIEYLTRNVEGTEEAAKKEIKAINGLKNLAKDFETEV